MTGNSSLPQQRRFQIFHEVIHVLLGRIPGAHQSSSSIRAYVIVKAPTSFVEFVYRRLRDFGKNCVPLPRIKDYDLGRSLKPFFQPLRHEVGVSGSFKPSTIFEIPKPRGR